MALIAPVFCAAAWVLDGDSIRCSNVGLVSADLAMTTIRIVAVLVPY
jgi:hypothetical protein